jgi:2-hydroxychromene-2-carboxylate isomerase
MLPLRPRLQEAALPTQAPVLFFDLGSPYAYLALERAESVLGRAPDLQPVLLGAIFAKRGFGSWAQTSARAGRAAEIEGRASHYGLPPLKWPAVWPANGLQAMRCAIWAKQQGAAEEFAKAVFRREFAEGGDISERELLLECASEAGVSPEDADHAMELPEIKRSLRDATEAAWDAGVRGVPSLELGGSIFYGDDQLELAAAALPAE